MTMTADRPEVIRVIERAKLELLYTRSILRTCIDDPELGNDVSAVLSRCSDTIGEIELLIARIRK
jgi:hypothetical protein